MTSSYQTLEESTAAEEQSGEQEFTNIPLPQVGYPGYNGGESVGQHPSQYRPAYRTRSALKLGILQIVLGTMAIVCGTVILVKRVFLYFTCMGIGAGAIFVAAGIFGVVSSRQKATWAIVTCMVLSIVSAVASGVSIIVSAEGIDLHYKVQYRSKTPKEVDTGIIMHIVLIVCCILEMVVSVLQATCCCRATCCMAGNSRPEIMVVYLPQPVIPSNQHFGGTPVPSQTGQAMLMVPPTVQQHGQDRQTTNAFRASEQQNGVITNGEPRSMTPVRLESES